MKPSRSLLRSTQLLVRPALRSPSQSTHLLRPTYIYIHAITTPQPLPSRFSTTRSIHKGLQPDTSDPAPPNTEPTSTSSVTTNASPADLTDSDYHEISDQYLNTLLLALEDKAEDPDAGYEVEYSAGVLTLTTPKGTYVINKQPPNKQIWLSSPLSGPKRYDWVIPKAQSEAQSVKEGTEDANVNVGDDGQPGGGKWVYLRDGSTMTDTVKDEIGVEVQPEVEDTEPGREGPGGSG